MSDERTPSLSSFLPERKPGVPRSTTNAEMPFLPAARSVTAMTTAVSAIRPLVMKFFEPLSTQCRPSRTAVVRMPPASEPEPGSVRPQQPTFSPRASGGRKRRFCSSLPARLMWAEQRLWWAASESATPASTRASSSITIAQSSIDSPEPPYSSGQHTPASPELARAGRTPRAGTPASRPTRASAGASSASAKSRTVFRSSACSSLSSKSMGSWYTASRHAAASPFVSCSPPPSSWSALAALGLGRPARPLRGARPRHEEPGADAPHGPARGGGEGEGPQGARRPVLGAALARCRATSSTPSSPPRTRTSSGTRASTGRRSRSRSRRTCEKRPLRARRQHDHPAAGEEPLLRHQQDARPQGCASSSSRAGWRPTSRRRASSPSTST